MLTKDNYYCKCNTWNSRRLYIIHTDYLLYFCNDCDKIKTIFIEEDAADFLIELTKLCFFNDIN